jgi:hypothetical protein
MPFDKLRANGVKAGSNGITANPSGITARSNGITASPSGITARLDEITASPNGVPNSFRPFGLSLSKPLIPWRTSFDKLRTNGVTGKVL